MARVLATLILACLLIVPRLVCQTTTPANPPGGLGGGGEQVSVTPHETSEPSSDSSSIAAEVKGSAVPRSAAGPIKVSGTVSAIEGGVLPGVAVWAAKLATPDQPLVETRAGPRGHFFLEIPPGEEISGFLLRARTQGGREACESLDLLPAAGEASLRLLLRKPGENFVEPSLDTLDEWLLPRIKEVQKSRQDPPSERRALENLLDRYRRHPDEWETLAEVLTNLRHTETPEARLLAAAALMRVGGWASADSVLGTVSDAEVQRERAVLEGVRWNFLRNSEEATKTLLRALENGSEDPLAQLELGRAEALAENWAVALQRLDPALRNKKTAPQAHYLRARCLLALGDVEGAAQEVKLLTRKVKKKRLPEEVQGFVTDILGRLEERSIQPVRSVMTQSVAELQKAVPNLAGLDASEPPPGQDLETILRRVGANIEKFFRDFANTSALEVIRQARLDSKGNASSVRMAELYYVFLQKQVKGQPMVEEYRGSGDGKVLQIGGLDDGFMVTSGFVSSLIVFHPFYQKGVLYRYLGRQEMGGRSVYVIGFAQRPEASDAVGVFRGTRQRGSSQVYVQGVAWISADQFQVLRLRTDLLEPIVDVELNRQTSEIDYRPYHFINSPKTFFLPSRVTVSIEWGHKRLRNEHIFSRFWLFNVDVDSEDVTDKKKTANMSQRVGSQ